jgi:hypothetical protein
LTGSSGYIADSAELSANRWIARDLRARGYLAYSQNGYRDIGRTEWAGEPGGKDGAGGGQPATSGSKKGDLFGDLFVILRDDNGVPILTAEGWVQPLDANGNLIPLDDEGHPVDESLTVEVELGRLNEEKTIDSPLENLALYIALVTDGTIPGLTADDMVGTSFDFMVDGVYTIEDLDAAKAFLAAATDKTGVFTTDEIAYIDAFLGINLVTVGDVTYSVVDYSAFTYDRSDTFDGVMTTVLIEQSDGSWLPTEIDVYDVVFDGIDVTPLPAPSKHIPTCGD